MLRKWLKTCEIISEDGVDCKISGAVNEEAVKLFRRILAPHKLVDGKILIEGENAAALALSLGNGKTVDITAHLLCWKQLICFRAFRLKIKRRLMWVDAWGVQRKQKDVI